MKPSLDEQVLSIIQGGNDAAYDGLIDASMVRGALVRRRMVRPGKGYRGRQHPPDIQRVAESCRRLRARGLLQDHVNGWYTVTGGEELPEAGPEED